MTPRSPVEVESHLVRVLGEAQAQIEAIRGPLSTRLRFSDRLLMAERLMHSIPELGFFEEEDDSYAGEYISPEKMPSEFNVLARYNTEVAHGIVHTPEWKSRMAILQARFDAWAAATAPPGTVAVTRVTRVSWDGDES